MVDLKGLANEQRGYRPCIICQNNMGNKFSPNVSIIPLTTSLKKTNIPTHVIISPNNQNGLKKTSVALCENPSTVSKKFISKKIGSLSREYIQKIVAANLIARGMIGLLSEKDSYESLRYARERVSQYV